MSTDERTVDEPRAAPAAEVDDAADLRGHYFRRLLLRPLTLISIIAGPLVVGALFYLMAGPVLGGFMLLLSLFLGVLIVRHKAGEHADDDFNRAYARSRDYQLGGSTYLGSATPLLRRGDRQFAEQTFIGELAAGVSGLLAIYTYVVETTDTHGNRQEDDHPFTLGMVEVPECVAHVPELYCQRKFGLHSLERVEDAFRRSKERVEFESDALGHKYEIFTGKGQDQNWLRQLFEPSFIVWLTDSAPEHFAFELVNGTLVAYVHGHKEDAADLDKMAAASATVAKRLRDESIEQEDR
ncbi:MAG TPA: hypothetical protein VMH33_12215 [Solirubrobacterales bacterium]|nr:hypothetical protein [Solirubrobacterales bacterium]